MRKYLETAKVLFKSRLAYRFDIITSIIFTVSKIILAYILWGAVYEQQEIISGFTFNSMLSYYIISSFIIQLDQSTDTGRQISNEIKNGSFSKYIVRPMSIFGYFTAHTWGISAFLFSFNLMAAFIWIFLFGVEFVFVLSAANILSSMALIILGMLFMMQLNYLIGILAFKFIDTSVFMMIKDNFVEFITGSFIPLALLPPEIVRIMSFFPFYYTTYLPTMILLGRNGSGAAAGIIALVCWNAALKIINIITYNRLKSLYDGVGI